MISIVGALKRTGLCSYPEGFTLIKLAFRWNDAFLLIFDLLEGPEDGESSCMF
jgi:hypothetical protein